MQKLTYILCSLSVFVLVSCQTLVENVTLPYQERLVINAFVSPQDTIVEVKVSKTSPVVGTFSQNYYFNDNTYQPIEGVTIEISDGQRRVNVPLQSISYPQNIDQNGKTVYAIKKGYFLKTKDFPFIAGKTYNLTASAANLPTVTASCTIPQKRISSSDYQILGLSSIDSVQSGYGTTSSPTGAKINYRTFNLYKRLTVLVKDFASEENFYTIAYYTRNVLENKDAKGNIITTIESRQQHTKDLISDYKQDGALLQFKKVNFFVDYYSEDPSQNQYNNYNNYTPKRITLLIHIAVIDKAYYQYLQSININNAGVDNGNPFAEPVLTYSNIQGGLGVFAGFNTTPIELVLK